MADERWNAYQLAGMAGCASPDKLDSPGAQFLQLIASTTVDAWEDTPEEDRGAEALQDDVSEYVDGCVPVYTFDVWQTFTDLAAWQEDVTEYGPIEDMERAAMIALCTIGQRLAMELLTELATEVDA